MKKVIDLFIREKLMVFLTIAFLMLAGYFSIVGLNKEAFPDISLDMVTVLTIYPGAAPDEIENLVTIPLEKKIREVSGISKVESFNLENVSMIITYLDDSMTSKKKTRTISDIQTAIDSVSTLPSGARKPEVEEITTDKMPALDIALMTDGSNEDNYRVLRETAKQLKEDLLFVDGIAEVETFGYKDREYLVEVDPKALKKYRIGLNIILYKLQAKNLDLPGGVLRVDDKEFILRTVGQFENSDDVKNTVIFSNDAGFVTRIKDIAKVSDTYEEDKIIERVNGKKAIILRVKKKKAADLVTISEELYQFLGDYQKKLPTGLSTFYYNDSSLFVRDSLSSLVTNAAAGIVLLLLILFLLLGPRMASIVTVSIPVAFMITFIVMAQQHMTLNVISMFALVMVLGMIVDFSIVISENAYRYMENGVPKREAVEMGVQEVAASVTVTFLCIVSAFAPLLFVSGLIGKAVHAIPVVIIVSLFASWICAIFILPAFLDTFAKVSKKKHGEVKSKNGWYTHLLTRMVKYRYLVVISAILILIGTTIIGGKSLRFVLMTNSTVGVNINAKMPQGSNLEATRRAVLGLEKIVLLLPKEEIDSVQTKIGAVENSGLEMAPTDGTHRASIIINFVPDGERKRSGDEILAELRKKVDVAKKEGKIDSRLEIKFEQKDLGIPSGKAVKIEIRGNDLEISKKIAAEYMEYLKTIEGVVDLEFDLEDGKMEYQYRINDEIAAKAGLSVVDSAQALLTSFQGIVPTKVKKEDEEIDVRVRFPSWARRSEKSLDDVVVANNYGGLVPLSKITSYEKKQGYSMISRKDYMRVVYVRANVDLNKITSREVNKKLQDKFINIESEYPDFYINYGGENEDTSKSLASLGKLFILALFIIYMLLAVFFNSLILPIVIMGTIPFSIIGVIFALLTHGQPMSFMTVLGLFSLAGVIVSNTLVLVQFINNLRKKEGMNLKDAVVQGGAIRFRPVLLTSGTTVLGLIPTIYGFGGKDAFVAPLGLAFGYGLVFATIITLLLVPCFYHIAEDIKSLFSKFLSLFGIKMDATLI